MRRARQVTNTQLAIPRTAKSANMPTAIRMNFRALPPDLPDWAAGIDAAGGVIVIAGEADPDDAGLISGAGVDGAAIELRAVPHLMQKFKF